MTRFLLAFRHATKEIYNLRIDLFILNKLSRRREKRIVYCKCLFQFLTNVSVFLSYVSFSLL